MALKKIQAGDIFPCNEGGSCKVIKYSGCRNITIEFTDSFKHQAIVRAEHLRSGAVKNPYFPSVYGKGYLGVGAYKSSEKNKKTRAYSIWNGMMARCYSDEYKVKNPTYLDCKVCESWWNFQSFAQWLTQNAYYEDDFEVDKDILVKGNKEYSPSTCALVPHEINTLLVSCQAVRGDYKVGVTKDSRSNNFYASVCEHGQQRYIGSFETEFMASQAYAKAKKMQIIKIANKWRGRIDERVYDALMNWRVTQ